jgi:hypothetical protein
MKSIIITAITFFAVLIFCDKSAAQNVAKGKVATQSSIYAGFDAHFAVDGDEKGQFTHTNSEQNAWWQVDLGAAYDIGSIQLWNRTDCCGERLSDFYIFVSEKPFETTDINMNISQSSKYVLNEGQMGASKEFIINAKGRYVRVELKGTNYLNLVEVQIESGGSGTSTGSSTTSTPVDPGKSAGQNVALNKPAKQSSDYVENPDDPAGKANLAVNGAIDPQTGAMLASWYGNQVTHTKLEKSPWWQVDLGRSYDIQSITVWNRTDCCGERLSDYYVFLSQEPFNETASLDQILLQTGTGGKYKVISISGPNGISEGFTVWSPARYVRIQLKGENILSLGEVQVFSGTAGTTPAGNTSSTGTTPSGQYDLTGVWQDETGGTYTIRQVGNQIWWYMDHKPAWTNVFKGILSGNNISGEWCDIAGGTLGGKNTGSLTLKVVSADRLEKVSSSFPYGGSKWVRLNWDASAM